MNVGEEEEEYWWVSQKERHHYEGQDVNWWIILN
jgi:hypothetical protein